MTNQQLIRSLNSIGKGCFVKYFDQFNDNQCPNLELIELLMEKENYAESGSRTRVNQARKIIAAGRAMDALKLVESSTRVPKETVQEASRLLQALETKFL